MRLPWKLFSRHININVHISVAEKAMITTNAPYLVRIPTLYTALYTVFKVLFVQDSNIIDNLSSTDRRKNYFLFTQNKKPGVHNG